MYASKSVFRNISSKKKPLKQFFISRDKICKPLQSSRKEAVGNAQRLFPYCQLADKFSVIFRVVFGILRGVLRLVHTFFLRSCDRAS